MAFIQHLNQLNETIIFDYDQKQGHFVHLSYTSPYELVDAEVARLAGHSIEDIRASISWERICRANSSNLDLRNKYIYSEWIAAYKKYLREINFIDIPSSHLGKSFSNISDLKKFCYRTLKDTSLEHIQMSNTKGHFELTAERNLGVNYSMSILFRIIKKYGGIMEAIIFLREYDAERKLLNTGNLNIHSNLMGRVIFSSLGITAVPESFEPVAEHEGLKFDNVKKVLGILANTSRYYDWLGI